MRSPVGAVPSPNTGAVVADEPVRRREDEEGGENVNDSTDRDLAAAYDPEDFETGVNEEEEEEEESSNEIFKNAEGNQKRDFIGGETILHVKGADKYAPSWIDKKTGERVYAYDENSKVKIVNSDTEGKTIASWDKVKIDGTHERIGSDGKPNDQGYRGDIRSNEYWPGPNSEFLVNKVAVIPGWGGTIEISLKDGTNVRLLHFTEINMEIFNKQGTGQFLPANTYLGKTGKIGYSTGSHLHMEAMNGNKKAKDYTVHEILNKMREEM
ncbi:M23 family metallopeptidase [Leptospira sp. 96542]|nr:M23 family metallopeptidase [Leptospira sp. 96542]